MMGRARDLGAQKGWLAPTQLGLGEATDSESGLKRMGVGR